MKVLITGVSGFVGSHLAERYLAGHVSVHGTVRERSDLSNIEKIKDRLTLHHVDVTDAPAVDRLLAQDFGIIHHLAAVSYIPTSWDYPSGVFQTNTLGTLNFLESLRNRRNAFGGSSIFHFAGTCEEYGRVHLDEKEKVDETRVLRPTSPYAISKAAADMLCQVYFEGHGVRSVITRAFNHTGDRRGKDFVTKTVCRQAAEIVLNRRQQFSLGNATAVRDWTDVRDICSAYMLAVQNAGTRVSFGEPYNVCSGMGLSVRDLVKHVAAIADIPDRIATDQSKLRPLDNPRLVGDCSKFEKATGWKPRHAVLDTLTELFKNELLALERAQGE